MEAFYNRFVDFERGRNSEGNQKNNRLFFRSFASSGSREREFQPKGKGNLWRGSFLLFDHG